MKKIGTSLLFLTALLLTGCSSNGLHAGSRFNLISSLFENAERSQESAHDESSITTDESDDNSSETKASSSLDYPKYETIDIDLTTMNATMVYSEVNNMLSAPSSYVGKIVKTIYKK